MIRKKERQEVNKARIDLIHWIRDNKGEALRYCNKTQLCDKVNGLFMPLITKNGAMPNPPFPTKTEKE